MPSYITKILNGGICQPLPQQSGNCSSFSRDSSNFFSSLATKLLEMATAVNKRINDIKQNCGSGSRQSGFMLASIEAPVMTVGVKYEYIEYIKRFGPPTEGKFDETKLKQLRTELGIDTNSATSL